MNKKRFIRRVSEVLHENEVKKPVHMPRQVFHISDDEGNSKNFVVRQSDKQVSYTLDDVTAIVDACLFAIKEALQNGESVTVHGFGSIGLCYRKPRRTKHVGSHEEIIINGRYVPKFSFGNELRMCAKVYEMSLNEKYTEDWPDVEYPEPEDGEEDAD